LPMIESHRAEIADLCRRFHVSRLDVFGSAARVVDFDPARSDIDILVSYAPDDQASSVQGRWSMEHDPHAFLWDVHQAAQKIGEFVQGRDLGNYLADPMLRSAVERQFEIIGEALNQRSKAAPQIAARIPDLSRAVTMRNVLIHGYAQVDNEAVWRTVQDHLPALRACVAELVKELGDAR
jgi:uncharacterized protein with HEPN domain